MILHSHNSQTSKHFCSKINHTICDHDYGNHKQRYSVIKSFRRNNELNLLRKKESSYQKLLENILSLKHKKIKINPKRNYYTDLSDENVIIEIKNVTDFRSSVGQILCYHHAQYINERKRVIVLFGDIPSLEEITVFIKVCKDIRITLIWVELEELIELYQSLITEKGINEKKKESVSSLSMHLSSLALN